MDNTAYYEITKDGSEKFIILSRNEEKKSIHGTILEIKV